MSRSLLYLSAEKQRWLGVVGGQLVDILPEQVDGDLVVIADFVEEALVRASVPKLFGRDQGTLVERRLQTEFRETSYRASYRLGPGKAPKTLDYLFIGLPNAAALDQRLRPLLESGMAIAGVWTVSLLVSWWARQARAEAPRQLVLLPTPSGIRHVFLEHGRPVLSRLTGAHDLGSPEGARALGEELERTVLYLYNARIVERGSSLPTWVWGDAPACRALPGLPIKGVEFELTPARRGLPDPDAEGIDALLRLATASVPPVQLARDALRLHHFADRARRGVTLAAGVGVLALLLFAGGSAWQQRALAGQLDAVLADTNALLAEQDRIRASTTGAEVDALTVREAIQAWQQRIAAAPLPGPWLADVSRAFEQAPAFRLEQLGWQLRDPSTAQGATLGSGSTLATECPAAPAAADAEFADPASAPPLLAGLALSGRVDDVSLREALAARERFERTLQAATSFSLGTAGSGLSSAAVIRGGADDAEQARDFSYCLTPRSAP